MKGHRVIDLKHLGSWDMGLLERTDHMMRRIWGKLWYGFGPCTEVVLRITQVDGRPSERTRRTFVRESRVRSYQDKLLWHGPQRRRKQKPWTKEDVDEMKVELLLSEIDSEVQDWSQIFWRYFSTTWKRQPRPQVEEVWTTADDSIGWKW